jgi:queuine tRNA-ribosyltransferase
MGLDFEILATDGAARLGRLETPHGEIETPAFQPVATLGAVKGVPTPWLEEAGAQILLSNLYHLSLRPGIEAIADLGGLHRFVGWSGPMLTDSGGYQVFSLAGLRTVDADGVTFRSHLDGDELRFDPESVVADQRRLGVDIAMMLDECPPYPVERALAAAALDRTNRWARRAREAWERAPGAGGLFAIAQGSVFPELRERAAAELSLLDFDGYAIGGVSVGEPAAERHGIVAVTAPALPPERVRYLMGVGTPGDIVSAVSHGVDLFDCVLPTRNARHGLLFTRDGVLRIKNARYRDDERPLDEACGCPACRLCGRAYLHHLVRSGELTGAVLASLHNLRYYLDFMAEVREAIASGRLAQLAASVADRYGADTVPGGRPSPESHTEK